MRPTWNNVTQAPGEFIRQFQDWRDEIFNYKSAVQSEIAVSMKMALLLQHIQGDIRSHLLLTENLAKPNFEDAEKKVEEYYRNVYVDNNFGGVNGVKGKYYKGKGKDNREKVTTETTAKQAKEKVTRVTTRTTKKEKESTPQDHTMSKEKATEATQTTTVDPKEVTTTTAEKKAKAKDDRQRLLHSSR
eukprot:2361862-Amphidinium_carterae.2